MKSSNIFLFFLSILIFSCKSEEPSDEFRHLYTTDDNNYYIRYTIDDSTYTCFQSTGLLLERRTDEHPQGSSTCRDYHSFFTEMDFDGADVGITIKGICFSNEDYDDLILRRAFSSSYVYGHNFDDDGVTFWITYHPSEYVDGTFITSQTSSSFFHILQAAEIKGESDVAVLTGEFSCVMYSGDTIKNGEFRMPFIRH